jgi:hypothetical protein
MIALYYPLIKRLYSLYRYFCSFFSFFSRGLFHAFSFSPCYPTLRVVYLIHPIVWSVSMGSPLVVDIYFLPAALLLLLRLPIIHTNLPHQSMPRACPHHQVGYRPAPSEPQ